MGSISSAALKTDDYNEDQDRSAIPYDGLITSSYKVAGDRKRLADYLAGKNIYPVSVEFDLTDKCNRSCPGCPSVKASTKHFLSFDFIDRMLGMLEGQTHGLLFTGGEPTIAPLFFQSLELAAKRKFKETAVVSNGKCLDAILVRQGLLEHVTSLRVSLYDWAEGLNGPLSATLKNIRSLRELIERTGSDLCIGVSVLTDRATVPNLEKMVSVLSDSGAHWVYFHPRCDDWELGRPVIVDQTGVLEEIKKLQKAYREIIPVFVGQERYSMEPVKFSTYHAAHFLLVVGADGKNYLSPETKYNPDYVLAETGEMLKEGFLWQKDRLTRMRYTSDNYRCIGSRHRTVLYNGLIESLQNGQGSLDKACSYADQLIHPYIL